MKPHWAKMTLGVGDSARIKPQHLYLLTGKRIEGAVTLGFTAACFSWFSFKKIILR